MNPQKMTVVYHTPSTFAQNVDLEFRVAISQQHLHKPILCEYPGLLTNHPCFRPPKMPKRRIDRSYVIYKDGTIEIH